MEFRINKTAAVLSIVLAFVSGPVFAQTMYRLTEIRPPNPIPGEFNGQAAAINDAGQVAGFFVSGFLWNGSEIVGGSGGGSAISPNGQVTGGFEADDGTNRAFRWNGATKEVLSTLGGRSAGTGINDAGQVVGVSEKTPGALDWHVVLWNGATIVDLGPWSVVPRFNATYPRINASGQVTGTTTFDGVEKHAFLWDGTKMVDLGTLGGTYSSGVAINNAGQVTGFSSTAGDAETHAFLWNGTKMVDLGTLGGTYSQGFDINESGQVVGLSSTADNSEDAVQHVFRWDGERMEDLGTLNGAFVLPVEINDSGDVLGRVATAPINHAFGEPVVSHGSSLVRLSSVIDPTEPLQVEWWDVGGLNNHGQVVGGGCTSAGCYAYIATPVSRIELSSLTLQQSNVAGCKSVIGTITLSGQAPSGGLTVSLTDTLTAATVPTSVTIPSGANSTSFSIRTIPVADSESGAVRATHAGKTISANLTVRPMGLQSITLTPSTAVGSNSVTGKATLECKAGPGPILVDLSSSNPAIASPVAANISVPQGLAWQLFTVNTNPVLARTVVTVSGSANNNKRSKTLTVTPAATVSPTSYYFGSVTVGTTSAPMTATLTNKGTVAFSVNSINLTGTYASWFVRTHNCPASLPAGASCTISTTFKPKAVASRSASLKIATGATSTPLNVSLSGTGI